MDIVSQAESGPLWETWSIIEDGVLCALHSLSLFIDANICRGPRLYVRRWQGKYGGPRTLCWTTDAQEFQDFAHEKSTTDRKLHRMESELWQVLLPWTSTASYMRTDGCFLRWYGYENDPISPLLWTWPKKVKVTPRPWWQGTTLCHGSDMEHVCVVGKWCFQAGVGWGVGLRRFQKHADTHRRRQTHVVGPLLAPCLAERIQKRALWRNSGFMAVQNVTWLPRGEGGVGGGGGARVNLQLNNTVTNTDFNYPHPDAIPS